ncbi:MAG: carboxypeptidase-like regulatory domain-containing protein, partial [Armatimonadota bacterium]
DYANQDVLTPSSADWTERGVGLIGNRAWGRGDLRLELHHDKQTDNLALLSEWVTRGAFYATYRPNDRLFLGASANVGGQGPLAASRLLWQTNTASLSASWIPNNRWNMHANWQTSAFDQTDMDTGNMYTVGVLHTLPNDHLIELTATSYRYGNAGGDYNEAALTYTVPFGIPVGRRTDIGILGGRVTDEAGVGIGGAVLSIGSIQAMSAADGSYMFPELAPGSYTVSTTSLGENRVAEQRTLVAEVAAGRRAVLDVRVLPSATVVGLITVGGSGTEDLAVAGARRSVLAPNSPLVGLLVECSQGEETFRTLSDGDGKFIFENLGAGTWHVKIYDNAMPSGYYLEMTETDLVLETGKTAEFNVRALPRIRPIRMSDGSTTSPLAPMIAKASTDPTAPLVGRASTAPTSPLIARASTAPKTPVTAPNTQSAVSATTRPAPGTKTAIPAITNRDRNPGTSVTVKPAAASSGKATSAAAAASKATAIPVAVAPAKPAPMASASAVVQSAKATAAASSTSAQADVMNYDIVVAGTVVFRLTNRFNYRTLTERGGMVDHRLEQVVNDRWNTPAKAQASPRPDVWLIMGNGTVIIEVSKADATDAGAPSIASLAQDWANRLNKALGRK